MASLGSPTLDCFRNGSVIQLKSKVTGKTLLVQEGGVIVGDGHVGFYAGNLGPRTPVWGRWTDGTYHRGTISNVDYQVHIKFNDGDTISHNSSDQTSVLADVNPDLEAVQVGSRVIAQYQGSARYHTGRVMKADKANPRDPTFDIHFDDGDKGPAKLNQIRMLPELVSMPTLGTPPIVPHSRIIGRWTNNQYYRGIVTNVGCKVDITFDDGDKVQHDPSDIGAVFYDVNPKPGTIQLGTRVVGFWPKSNHFYLGKVAQVDYMNPHSPRYFVHFDDGDKVWCNLNEIRPVPLRRESVGCVVWGRWTNKCFYRGKITECSHGKVHITFDDGDSISHSLSDIGAVLVDVVPNPANISTGSRVIAAFPGQTRFYPGRVSKIDSTNFYAPRYYVNYDDGDQGWVNFDQVRLLPMKVDQVGTVVWGRWTNNLYFKGKVEKVDSKIHIVFDDGDRIGHSPSDVTAIILDTTPNPESVTKGSRVIAEWPGKSTLYPGRVIQVDRNNPYQVRYYVHYDDGDKGWVVMNQLKLIPAPGPSVEAQFSVVQVGGNVVALRNIAYPQYFLGVSGGQLFGKGFDNYCHFYVHETPDHYVSLEFCMFPGQHVGVHSDGTALPPASTTKSNQAFFEVKLLFSPFGQTYQAEHGQAGGYPAPTPSYPSPFPHEGGYPQPGGGGYPPAPPPGGYPAPPPGGYPGAAPPPGGYPGGYPTGPMAPPAGAYPTGHHPPAPPGGYPAGPYHPSHGGHYPPSGTHQPPGGYPGYGAPPPYQ